MERRVVSLNLSLTHFPSFTAGMDTHAAQQWELVSAAGSRPCPARCLILRGSTLLPRTLVRTSTTVQDSQASLDRPQPGNMGERRAHSLHMTCHVQRDYGSRMGSSFISCSPNGYASNSLSFSQEMDADLTAERPPEPGRSHYSPVSLELDPTAVNNGADTKDPALQMIHGLPSTTSVPPPLPRSSWMHRHQKDFQSPYINTSMQGDVYNFLERPAGLKCFLYHFLVWVPVRFSV